MGSELSDLRDTVARVKNALKEERVGSAVQAVAVSHAGP